MIRHALAMGYQSVHCFITKPCILRIQLLAHDCNASLDGLETPLCGAHTLVVWSFGVPGIVVFLSVGFHDLRLPRDLFFVGLRKSQSLLVLKGEADLRDLTFDTSVNFGDLITIGRFGS